MAATRRPTIEGGISMTDMFSIRRMAQVGTLAAIVAFAAGSTAALAAGESRDENSPVAEATITNMEEDTTLVDTKSAAMHTVCADQHGTTNVVVSYDDKQTTISPGHCALLEAGMIQAHADSEGQTHVTVHDNSGHGGHEGKTN